MKNFTEYTINANGRLMNLSEPQVMGVLNVTPDSFYAGSRKQTEHDIAERTNRIISEGASIIDIGAYSTRPGAATVSDEEEMTRMRRALCIVRREQPEAVLSIDTFRPGVAKMAVEEFGAGIINDVSAGNINGAFGGTCTTGSECSNTDSLDDYPEMFRMVARLGVPYILMSIKSDINDMMFTFSREVQLLRDLGVKDIILDPGFGFGKTLGQNYRLMNDIYKLHALELPLLVGVSRKSMIFKLLNTTPDESLNGTTVLNTIALMNGASILRVHDVKQCVEAVKITRSLNNINKTTI